MFYVLSEGICREKKKIMGFSYFPQNNSAYVCVVLVCSSNRVLALINFLINIFTIFSFLYFPGQGNHHLAYIWM